MEQWRPPIVLEQLEEADMPGANGMAASKLENLQE